MMERSIGRRRRTGAVICGSIVGLLALAAPAWAQQHADTKAYRAPAFVTLDKVGTRSGMTLSFSSSSYGDDGPDFNGRFDLRAQLMDAHGFGGYAVLPFSVVNVGDETETGVGHFELGGFYRVSGASAPFVVRAGFFLPSATGANAAINGITGWGRFTDAVGLLPETTSFRLSGSHMRRMGQLFVRADLGMDVIVDPSDGTQFDPFVRGNLGVGFDSTHYAATVEFVTLATTLDDVDDRFQHTLAFSAHLQTRSLEPYVALVAPFGDGDGGPNVIIALGARLPLGRK